MKIVIVTHTVVRGDGQGRVNLEVAHHCLREGCDVTLVSGDVDPDLLRAGARWKPLYPRLRRPMLARVREFVARANRIVETLEADADVVMANGYTLTRPHQVNACHFVHAAWRKSSANPHQSGRGLRSWYQREYARRNCGWELSSYRAAANVIAVSDMTRRELLNVGLAPEKVQVIFNGVDLDEFHPGSASRAAFNLPAEAPIGIFAGDLRTSRKNLDTVFHAMMQVKGMHLAVVGRTERSEYPALAQNLGIADRVHFLGFRKDMAAIMRACDFFIFPSRYDPCCLVVLEAMACGLPVIVAATAGASAYVSPDTGIVLNDPNNVIDCAGAMQRLVDNSALRRSMSIAGRTAAERHSWRQVGASYLEVFRRAAARRAPKTGVHAIDIPAETTEAACQ